MRQLRPIQNHPNLARDMRTGAVLNINKEQIEKDRQALKQKRQEQQEIEQLKSDVFDIKQMLTKLLELSKNG